jgi:hypothetical protein
MTVRTWITLSVLILVALSVATVVRLLTPVVPEVVARSGETHLDGTLIETCWPQRGGDLRCEKGDDRGEVVAVEADGTFNVIVVYPAQPDEGRLQIRRGGKTVVDTDDWERELDYDLEAGTYELIAEGRYPEDAFVRFRFAFRVAR